jgi:hypothetical protein
VLRFLASVLLIYHDSWSKIIVLSCELINSFITSSWLFHHVIELNL